MLWIGTWHTDYASECNWNYRNLNVDRQFYANGIGIDTFNSRIVNETMENWINRRITIAIRNTIVYGVDGPLMGY